MSKEVSNIFEALKLLNPAQLICFKDLIYKKDIKISDEEFIKFIRNRLFGTERVCPHCGNSYIIKNGKNSLNKQRYKCKNCNKIFCNLTSSPVSYSKKSVEQWLKYIQCMSEGLSIRKSADIVKINRNTSFHWRHKILNAIKSKLPDNLEGIIEVDELYVVESFKGNHSKDRAFSMGRDPIKRGQYGLYDSKVCILCCRDRSGNIFSRAASIGQPISYTIDSLLNEKIAQGSVICTKNSLRYNNFAVKQNLKIYRIKSTNEAKEDIYHLKNVKAFERALKRFINSFKGVATKYLNFYITWFKWMELTKNYTSRYRLVDLFLLITSSNKKLRVCDFKNVTYLLT